MLEFIEVNEFSITRDKMQEMTKEIITILAKENITHAIACMILDNVKDELRNTIVKAK